MAPSSGIPSGGKKVSGSSSRAACREGEDNSKEEPDRQSNINPKAKNQKSEQTELNFQKEPILEIFYEHISLRSYDSEQL